MLHEENIGRTLCKTQTQTLGHHFFFPIKTQHTNKNVKFASQFFTPLYFLQVIIIYNLKKMHARASVYLT